MKFRRPLKEPATWPFFPICWVGRGAEAVFDLAHVGGKFSPSMYLASVGVLEGLASGPPTGSSVASALSSSSRTLAHGAH
jgi:hypothetical protein